MRLCLQFAHVGTIFCLLQPWPAHVFQPGEKCPSLPPTRASTHHNTLKMQPSFDCHDQIQNPENKRQGRTHKDYGRARICLDQRHSNLAPTITCIVCCADLRADWEKHGKSIQTTIWSSSASSLTMKRNSPGSRRSRNELNRWMDR